MGTLWKPPCGYRKLKSQPVGTPTLGRGGESVLAEWIGCHSVLPLCNPAQRWPLSLIPHTRSSADAFVLGGRAENWTWGGRHAAFSEASWFQKYWNAWKWVGEMAIANSTYSCRSPEFGFPLSFLVCYEQSPFTCPCHHDLSTKMDWNPLKPWAKITFSYPVPVMCCGHSAVKVTNTIFS